MKTLEMIDEQFKTWKESQEIKCPHCNRVIYKSGNPHDVDMEDLITYFGEECPQEMECYFCEETFTVQEFVERTFKVTK